MSNRDSSTNQIVKTGDWLHYNEAVRAFDLRFASTLTPAVRRAYYSVHATNNQRCGKPIQACRQKMFPAISTSYIFCSKTGPQDVVPRPQRDLKSSSAFRHPGRESYASRRRGGGRF